MIVKVDKEQDNKLLLEIEGTRKELEMVDSMVYSYYLNSSLREEFKKNGWL